MQYILSQEELDQRVPKQSLDDANSALEVARGMISGKTVEGCRKGYCDMCPVSDIGGEGRPSRSVSKLICKLPRNYHK